MAYNIPGSEYNSLYGKYSTPDTASATVKKPGVSYQAPELAGLNQSSQAPDLGLPAADTQPLPLTPAPATPLLTSLTTPAAAASTDTPAAAPVSGLPAYLQPIAGSLSGMLTPPKFDIGLSSPEIQSILNVGKQNIQGATDTAVEAARAGLGLRGFNPGESGVADSTLAGLLRAGSQNLTGYDTSNIQKAISDRFQQQVTAQTAYQNQLGTMGGLIGALGPAEQFGQEFPYKQQQDALALLMNYYGNAQGAQASAWAPYYSATTGAITGG